MVEQLQASHYIAVTVTCKIVMILCFHMEVSSLSIEEKATKHWGFFLSKSIYIKKITLTIMNCEQLGELDYNSNLGKLFFKITFYLSFS